MGILDDVLVNAKSAAELMSKKAVDIYDISKLKVSEANLKNELNKKYLAFGKAVYNKDDEKVLRNLEKEISELKANLADITKLYDSIKNSVVCITCGEHIPQNAQYCPVCGTLQETDVKFCSNCNQAVDSESFYCIHCGEKIVRE